MARKKRERKEKAASLQSLPQFFLENRIITLCHKEHKPLTQKEIRTSLQNTCSDNALSKMLSLLVKEKILHQQENSWLLAAHPPLISGKLTIHQRGFGFVETEFSSKAHKEKDPYIPQEAINGAIHGDTVLIRPFPRSLRKGRRESYAVVCVTTPAPNILCGIVREKRGDFLVSPDDSYIPFKIAIQKTDLCGAKAGDVVQVQFQREGGSSRIKPGKVLAVLGSPAQTDTQLQLTIEKFSLLTEFTPGAISYAKKLTMDNPGVMPRKDLTSTCHITIDGASAKDFDDAICIEQLDNGNSRLFVSIADVSHFVKPDTALDKEAYQRGTSVYFPGRVIPMLPEELSNNLCSLLPGQKRYTFTAQLDFDKKGELLRQKFYRSTICSKQRFTYDMVSKILAGDNTPKQEYKEFVPMLQQAEKLATTLRSKRLQRGAIDFNLREAVFTLDAHGEVASIKPAERNTAHRLIEEFMLIANEAVAEFLGQKLAHPIFRIHQVPNKEKIAAFRKIAEKLGISLQQYREETTWFSGVLQQAEGSQYEYMINALLLRSLSQAQYATERSGHFGLASPAYTHFTSPIRRYPDLMVHRMLATVLEAGEKKCRKQKFAPEKTKEAALFLSGRERTAIDAERDMNDRLKISYMKNRIGEIFAAVITGVSENTLFVELEDPMVSGAIPVEFLGNDYFFYDADRFLLTGEISRKRYQLGDRVEVELVSISTSRRQLTFAPTEK